MSFIDRLRFRARTLLHRGELDDEIGREMSFHLTMETERLVRAGVPEAEARRQAALAFGGRERFREETRDEVHSRRLSDLLQDLRHSARIFSHAPGFALAVIATVAIGVGATTTIFSVTYNVVIRALPYRDAGRLMTVEVPTSIGGSQEKLWPPNAAHFLAWKAGCRVCDGVAAARVWSFVLIGVGDPTAVSALRVSDDFFSVLGARAQLGRLIQTGDDEPGSRVVVLSDALWRQQFGANPQIVGQRIMLDTVPWTVIGVLAADFRVPKRHDLAANLSLPQQTDLFVPLALAPYQRTTAGEHDYGVLVRAKPGVTPEAMTKALGAISAADAVALRDDSPSSLVVRPFQETVVGSVSRPLELLLVAVGAMLLIICVNLANLFLARSASRRRETAVRMALGAGRERLKRQTLTETTSIALVGGLLGVWIAHWAVRALVGIAPADLPRIDAVHIDPRVLIVSVVVSIGCGLAFGIGPAFRLSRAAPGDVLKESARGASDGPSQAKLRSWLIASQIGLSALLLIVGGLLLKSFERVIRGERGFHEEHLLAADVYVPSAVYHTVASRNAYYENAMRRLAALPGVTGTGVTNRLPLEGVSWVDFVRRAGTVGETDGRNANFRFISPNYFDLLQIPLLAGRSFTEADRGARRVVLSDALAKALWPDESAVGRRVVLGGDSASEVIGIAATVRTTDLEHEGALAAYIPYWQTAVAPTLIVRTSGDPAALASAVRATLHEVGPSVPVTRIRTIGEIVARVTAQRRFELTLVGLFALMAFLTAAIGIYGVVAYSLNRRAGEFTLRIALGADAGSVHALVLREVLKPTAVGLAVGIAGALAVSHVLASLLYEVDPGDPQTIATVALVLVAVTAAACWLPARRVTRLDPVEALRAN